MTNDEKAFYEAWEERLKVHAHGLDFHNEASANVFYNRVRADVKILHTDGLCALAQHHGASENAISTCGAEFALTYAYMKAHRTLRVTAARVVEIEAYCSECEELEREEFDQVEYQYYGPKLVAIIRELLKDRKGRQSLGPDHQLSDEPLPTHVTSGDTYKSSSVSHCCTVPMCGESGICEECHKRGAR